MAVSCGSVADAQALQEIEQQYLIQTYRRFPLVVRRGKGCWLYDAAGKRYLDLVAGIGVNALGHAHPRILRVSREQAGLLVHCANLYYHDYQGPLARRLAEISGLQRCFFSNSGTEAVEGALKIARSYGRRRNPEKYEIVALENSFHGRSLGALSITGQPKYRLDFEPLLPGVRFVPRNDVAALEQAVGPQTAAIVLEWIQGEGGIHPVDVSFARRARELADQHDALLIFDEIQCGLGRTGRYFAYQLAEPPVLPDVTVVAKPLACGLPLGAIIANGQGVMRGKIFRIAHLGYFDFADIFAIIAGLEIILNAHGFPVRYGTGVAAAQKVYAEAAFAKEAAVA